MNSKNVISPFIYAYYLKSGPLKALYNLPTELVVSRQVENCHPIYIPTGSLL